MYYNLHKQMVSLINYTKWSSITYKFSLNVNIICLKRGLYGRPLTNPFSSRKSNFQFGSKKLLVNDKSKR